MVGSARELQPDSMIRVYIEAFINIPYKPEANYMLIHVHFCKHTKAETTGKKNEEKKRSIKRQ